MFADRTKMLRRVRSVRNASLDLMKLGMEPGIFAVILSVCTLLVDYALVMMWSMVPSAARPDGGIPTNKLGSVTSPEVPVSNT